MSHEADGLSETERRLQSFIDGELGEAERLQVERRLAADPGAARRVEALARQKRRLAAAMAEAAGDSSDPYTMTLVDGLARRLAPPRRRWFRAFGAAAALLAAGWWGNELHESAVGGAGVPEAGHVPELVADAAEIHHIFAEDPQHPVELTAAESDELAEWMAQHFGESAGVPDLRQVGLTFLGGRLLGNQAGPVAQLLYEARDGNRVSLYLSRGDTEGAAGESVRIVRVDGLNAGYWQEDSLTYALVAEASGDRLRSIASRLGASVDRL